MDKKIISYLDKLTDKQKKAVFAVIKAFAEENNDNKVASEQISYEIEARAQELDRDVVKGDIFDHKKKKAAKKKKK